MLKGIGGSAGIGLAPAVVLAVSELVIPTAKPADLEAEKAAFWAAHAKVLSDTHALAEKTAAEIGPDEAAVFEAHAMLLEDPTLTGPIVQAIESGENAAKATQDAFDALISMFESMDDEYMAARAADMRDLKERLLRALLHAEAQDISHLAGPAILVAHDLTPSDTAVMDKAHVVGILTEIGGRTAHSAIMARALGLPAVVGCAGVLEAVKNGVMLGIDGATGEVFVAPDETTLSGLNDKLAKYQQEKALLDQFRSAESVTADGHRTLIAANIGTPQDAEGAAQVGADAVGLFRSEFLYMDRGTLPTEEEQAEAYAAAAKALPGKPIIIRTLDIGGDKKLPALPLPDEENPFLGYRAIRLCLGQKDLFKTQLRALLRAAHEHDLRIMFPMISSLEELRAAKAVLEECKAELKAEGLPCRTDVPVGIMIEIPAAALNADALAKECDFFSIGTNDLIQYTTAVDRGNERVSHLYTPFHPSVLRLIRMTIEAAHRAGIFCGMCGEAASDTRLIPLLLGMGLDEFSMSAGALLAARRLIRSLSYEECKTIVEPALSLPTATEVQAYLTGLPLCK